MEKNKYGVKVRKRNYSLYKKKKSGFKKFLDGMLLIVAVGGLGLLGYSLGKPLMSYFSGEENTQSTPSPWTPQSEAVTEEDTHNTTPVQSVTAATEESVPAEAEITAEKMYMLQDEALADTDTFSKAILEAKNMGFKIVVFTAKDEIGNVLYKSQLEDIKDSGIVTGTLTLSKMYDICQAAEVELGAIINTLLDRTAPSAITGSGYRWADDSWAWMDNSAERGGKQWLNPFQDAAAEYLCNITEELAESGIKTIILRNTIYPSFSNYDTKILDKKFFSSSRYEKLTEIISKCADKNENTTVAAAKAADIINYEGFSGTAEFLKGDLGGTALIMAEFSSGDFSGEIKTSEESSVKLPDDTAGIARIVFTMIKNCSAAENIIPCIDSTEMTESEVQSVIETLEKLNYENYLIK